jgi:hypothetical protein
VDNIPPVITCQPNKTLSCESEVVFDQPTATDNCSGTPTIVIVVSDNTVGDVHTRTWKATDACGNTATCSQSVTVAPVCQSCTPGFWKNHPGIWNSPSDPVAAAAGFTTSTNFWTYLGFAGPQCGLPGMTMLEATALGGGDCAALARHGVSALLGAAAFPNSYPYPTGMSSLTDIKNALIAAYTTCTCEPLHTQLAAANEKGEGEWCSALSNRQLQIITTLPQRSDIQGSTPEVTVTAYPNPYSDNIRFTIKSTISGQGTLEVYDLSGAKLQIVYSGYIHSGKGQVIEYKVPVLYRTNMMYVLRVGGKVVTGKLLNIR